MHAPSANASRQRQWPCHSLQCARARTEVSGSSDFTSTSAHHTTLSYPKHRAGQRPGCVIVHSDLDPGDLMSVTFNLVSSDGGFRATGATCQCTYLAVVGLPCAHVIAGANAISVLRPGSRRTPKSDNAQSR